MTERVFEGVIAVLAAGAMGLAFWLLLEHTWPSWLRGFTSWPSQGFDRVVTGSPSGGLYECFDPPWHHARRWLWWFTKARRTEVLMMRNGGTHVVRAFVPTARMARPRFRGRRLS